MAFWRLGEPVIESGKVVIPLGIRDLALSPQLRGFEDASRSTDLSC